MIPTLIKGDISIDDRGAVTFANNFDFAGSPLLPPVRRFYIVQNHWTGMIRAWHGHKREAKYVMAIQGAALVQAVKLNNLEDGSLSAPVGRKPFRFVLSVQKPSVLFIPPGYANGWMSLTDDTRLMFFSTATLEESKKDDFRCPARYWDCWKVEER